MEHMGVLLAQTARGMGFDRTRNRAAYALAGVALFWIVGLLGGLRVLHSASSPMATLVLLYAMLAIVILSLVIAAVAMTELGRRTPPQLAPHPLARLRADRRSARTGADG